MGKAKIKISQLRNSFRNRKQFIKENERYLSIGFFLTGFIIDSITLSRIDKLFDNLILLSYLLLATICVLLINFHNDGKIKNALLTRISIYYPLIAQFAFGGLFSGYVIFYSKSSSFIYSWPFLLMIYLIFLGNEGFRKMYSRISFQINLLFIALFSFSIFYVPILTKTIADWVFFLSGFIALFLIWLFVLFLAKNLEKFREESFFNIKRNIVLIYFAFNVMYVTNIIPPIPLSIKEIETYHKVYIEDGKYVGEKQKFKWWEIHKKWGEKIYINPNGNVYVYTSVFAPTDLKTKITHNWYMKQDGKWVETDKITYPIKGGRDGGYRGYTLKGSIKEGDWRLAVTANGDRVVGHMNFKVIHTEELPEIKLDYIK